MIREDFAGEGGETSEYDLVVGELENDELVDLIYNNLFGRDATGDDGRDFWVNQLDEGESTLASIVGDVIAGIEEGSADAAIFADRIAAANYFTAAMEGKVFDRDDIPEVRGVLFSVTDGNAVNTIGDGMMITTGAGSDSITVTPDPDFSVSQLTMLDLSNLSIAAGGGDDYVEINGNFRFFIDAGAGSDYVYINSQVPALTGQWIVNTPSGPSVFADRVLYKAELTVTFAGFESTVDVETDAGGNFIADQVTINDAIKAAIDENPELSRLLSYQDGTANQQLIITSNVDGANNLSIDLFQPQLVAAGASPGAGEVNLATGEASSLLEGIVETDGTQDSDTDPLTYVNGVQGSLNADGTVGTAGAGAAESYDFMLPNTGGSADAIGVNNVNFSVINMGGGANNLVVLDSNDNSANMLVVDQTFGKVSVVNFFDDAALTTVGNHFLDFRSYLDNVTSASTGQSALSEVPIPVTLNTTATAASNSVSMLSLTGTATETFAGLGESNLITALNGDGTADDNYANITNTTLNAAANSGIALRQKRFSTGSRRNNGAHLIIPDQMPCHF